MSATFCKVCNGPGAQPAICHLLPLCADCHREWLDSPERAAAARAREGFVERRCRERGANT